MAIKGQRDPSRGREIRQGAERSIKGQSDPSGGIEFGFVDLDLLAAAKPWTYWLALPLVVASVVGLLGAILAYLVKAVAPKYPKT